MRAERSPSHRNPVGRGDGTLARFRRRFSVGAAGSMVVLAALVITSMSTAAPATKESTVSGRALEPGGTASAGGTFVLTRETLDRATLRGEGFVVKATPQGASAVVSKSGTGGCPCGGPIFFDGFESGDTSAWN